MANNFWKKLKRPIMAIAPMSGVTDDAFRLMFLKHGRPDIFWTEFVSADGLFSRGREVCLKILDFDKLERPIVAQVFGSNPENMAKTAQLVQELGFDGIDLNMGCPDRDIEKQGAGAALMKTPDLAKEIIQAVKKATPDFPISVKTRIGYNQNEIQTWLPVLLEEKVCAITIHFRTRKDLYAKSAQWELAKDIVKLRNQISPETLILGNGDVKTLSQAKDLAQQYELDGIMVGRSLIGNPWFFSDKEPEVKEKLSAIVDHAKLFEQRHQKDKDANGRYKQFESLKKHFNAYARGFVGAKELREDLMKTKTLSQVEEAIGQFESLY